MGMCFLGVADEPSTMIGVLWAACGALAAAVTYLYKTNASAHEKMVETISGELQECKQDREKLWNAISDMKSIMNRD